MHPAGALRDDWVLVWKYVPGYSCMREVWRLFLGREAAAEPFR